MNQGEDIQNKKNVVPFCDAGIEVIGDYVVIFYSDRIGTVSEPSKLKLFVFNKDDPDTPDSDPWDGITNPKSRPFSPKIEHTPDDRIHLVYSQYYAAVESSEVIYQNINLDPPEVYERHPVSGMMTHTLSVTFSMTFQHCQNGTPSGRYSPILVYDGHGLYNHFDHNIFYQREIQICGKNNLFFWLNTHEIGFYKVTDCLWSSVDECPSAEFDNDRKITHIVWDSRNSMGFNTEICKPPHESCVRYTSISPEGNQSEDKFVFQNESHEPGSLNPGVSFKQPTITTCGTSELLCLSLGYIYLDYPHPVTSTSASIRHQFNTIVYKKTNRNNPAWHTAQIVGLNSNISENLINNYKFLWKDENRTEGYLFYTKTSEMGIYYHRYADGNFSDPPVLIPFTTEPADPSWQDHPAFDAKYDGGSVRLALVSGCTNKYPNPDPQKPDLLDHHASIDYFIISDLDNLTLLP